MKKLTFLLLASFSLFATEEPDIKAISEELGRLIGKNLESTGLKLDCDSVAKGIQAAFNDGELVVDEKKCMETITKLQEEAFELEANGNLKKAETFLKENLLEKDVISLEDGKLQYKIITPGKGNQVASYNSPLIQYKGTLLGGKEFGVTKEAELIVLDETIEGFRKGIVGMKEGEKRIIHIHPDLAYGKSDFLEPNALITFEVEVVKADARLAKKPTIENLKEKLQEELAFPSLEDEKILR